MKHRPSELLDAFDGVDQPPVRDPFVDRPREHRPRIVAEALQAIGERGRDAFYGGWAQVEGPAEIVSLPDAMDGLVDYYRNVSGEHPDWDDYRAAMERDHRCLIRITPERAGPNISG